MLTKLIAHFANTEEFPIKVNAVREWIIGNGYADVIIFKPVSKDVRAIRGKFYRYILPCAPYAEPDWYIEVAIETDQSDCFKRYVAVKEMMHVFDMKNAWTNPKDVESLVMHLTGPTASGSSEMPADVRAESMAYHAALCVLAPIKAVRILRKKHEAGELNNLDVAKILCIPQKYTGWILSDHYERIYNVLSGNAFELRPARQAGSN